MKKRYLFYVIAGLLLIAQLTIVGCKQKSLPRGSEDTEEPDPGEDDQNVPTPQGPVARDLQVESIKFALFDKKGNATTFQEAKKFNKRLSGPYVLEKNPETAYIAVQIDKPKPDQGGDFIVCVENENSFLDKIRLYRNSDKLFATEVDLNSGNIEGNKVVALSEGENVIVVKIELDGESAEYKFNVKYDGGPKDDPKDKNQKLIPGIYCPTMRKLSQAEKDEGKKDEALVVACIAYYCGWCDKNLAILGNKGEKLATKYKEQGLRVVAIDHFGCVNDEQSKKVIKKWVDSGKGYPMYTKENNCLMNFFKSVGGYPYAVALKENKVEKEFNGYVPTLGSAVKKLFGFR